MQWHKRELESLLGIDLQLLNNQLNNNQVVGVKRLLDLDKRRYQGIRLYQNQNKNPSNFLANQQNK